MPEYDIEPVEEAPSPVDSGFELVEESAELTWPPRIRLIHSPAES